MQAFFDWISDPANVALLGAAWAGLLGAAQAVVRLTPTEADNRFVAKVGTAAEQARNVLTLQRPNASSRDQKT